MALDQGIGGQWGKGEGKIGMGLGARVKQDSDLFLLHCELPSTWLVFNSMGSELKPSRVVGMLWACKDHLWFPG